MKKQNKKLFDDKYQLRKISLSADNLILKYDIKFDNKHDFKFIFRCNNSFRIVCEFDERHLYFEKNERHSS